MIEDDLTKQMIKYILGNLGFVPKPLFGKVGLSDKFLKTKHVLTFEEDGNQVNHPIYAGEIKFPEGSLRSVGVAIHPGEFTVIFKFDSGEFNLLKNIDEEEYIFVVSSNGVDWQNPSMYTKLCVTTGIANITDLGYVWQPTKNTADLIAALKASIDI